MTAPVKVIAKPVDDTRCALVLSRPVRQPGVHKYTAMDKAADSPVAQAVLGVPGVCEVIVAGDQLTVSKREGSPPWSALAAQLRYAVRTAVEQAEAPLAGAGGGAEDDGAMFDAASDIFRTQINPWVAQHGGKVELIDVQDATVVLRMTGGCHGCGMASVTLRQGIEASLRRAIPSLKGIKDITDHAAGTNPYFRSQSSSTSA
jgi:Fe-S cluster biogenesis protein NfuA